MTLVTRHRRGRFARDKRKQPHHGCGGGCRITTVAVLRRRLLLFEAPATVFRVDTAVRNVRHRIVLAEKQLATLVRQGDSLT